MASPATLRNLKIKTGIVHRTLKELLSYQQELDDNKKMVDKVRASDDHSKLKQWENVVAETQGMIPDTMSRLSTAVDDLNEFINEATAKHSCEQSGELEQAKEVLASATKLLAA